MSQQNKTRTIVDVRTPDEFNNGHIDGALNIPLDEIPQQISAFQQMQKPIITYCRSGSRSGMAVQFLKQNGVTGIINAGSIDQAKQLIQ